MFVVQLGDIFSDFGDYISKPFERIGEGFSSGQPLKVLEGLVLGPLAIALAPVYGVTKIMSTGFGGLPIVGPTFKTASNIFESPGRTISNLVRGVPQILSGAATGFVVGNIPGAIGGAVLAGGAAGADKSQEYHPQFVGSLLKGVGYGIAGGGIANIGSAVSQTWFPSASQSLAMDEFGNVIPKALTSQQIDVVGLYGQGGVVTNLPADVSVSPGGVAENPGFFNNLYSTFKNAPIGSLIPDLSTGGGVTGFVAEHPYLTGGALLAAGGLFGGGSKSPTQQTQDQMATQTTDQGTAVGVQPGQPQSLYYPINYDTGQLPGGYYGSNSLPQPASVVPMQQAGIDFPVLAIGAAVIIGVIAYMQDTKRYKERKKRR